MNAGILTFWVQGCSSQTLVRIYIYAMNMDLNLEEKRVEQNADQYGDKIWLTWSGPQDSLFALERFVKSASGVVVGNDKVQ